MQRLLNQVPINSIISLKKKGEKKERREKGRKEEKKGKDTEDTVRQLIKRGGHEETPGFQNFAVFCPLCIVRGTGVCHKHSEVGHLVVARGTGWG